MSSENGKETLLTNSKNYGTHLDTRQSSNEEGKLSNDCGKVQLIEANRNIFRFFKVFGLYVIRYDENENRYRMSKGLFLFARICWFIFHVSGLICGVVLKKSLYTNDSRQTINDFLSASFFVLVFIIVDPIQTLILRRSMETLPGLLNEQVKSLEVLTKAEFGDIPRKVGLFPWENKINLKTNPDDRVDSKDKHKSNFDFAYTWEPKVTVTLLFCVFLSLFIYGFWLEAHWSKVRDEAYLVVMCFYLVFPILSTWFCVVFILYERQLYKIIEDNFKDEKHFKNKEKMRNFTSDYFDNMQVLFKTITESFFKFVFGMNSMIFVVCGIFCMFELLDGIDDARQFFGGFGEIFYAIPLTISIFHIFIICKFSHSLISEEHDKLRIRLNRLMTSVFLKKDEGDAGKLADDAMKRIEMLYKNLKDWPPQAEIYGGYKINYQILTGMILFIISYARVFKGILVTPPEEHQSTFINITSVAFPERLVATTVGIP